MDAYVSAKFKKRHNVKLNLHLSTVVCSVTLIIQLKVVDLASGLVMKPAIFPKYRPLTSSITSTFRFAKCLGHCVVDRMVQGVSFATMWIFSWYD